VVGGGISGLHCASTLAQYGYTVSLFDMGRSGPGMHLLTPHAAQQAIQTTPVILWCGRWPDEHAQDGMAVIDI
jgi:glycine/D-amino acid oxidase-like deaminating enzyme